MSASPSGGIPVHWYVQNLSVGQWTVPVARLIVALRLPTRRPSPGLVSEDAWLDTGAPLSVFPYHIHQQGQLQWSPSGVQVSCAFPMS